MSTAAGLNALFNTALAQGRTWVIGEQVGRMGGSGGAFAGLRETYPDRVLDLPIAEKGTLGLAIGMAMAGDRVVVELTSSGRAWSILEPLAEAAAIAAAGELPMCLVLRIPAGGQAGPRIDAPIAEALSAIDGLSVLCPSTSAQALGAYNAALAARTPTVILEPRALLTRRAAHADPVHFGVARVVSEGHHITLVSWGSGVRTCTEAAEQLEAEGYSVAVVDVVSLNPIDANTLGQSVRQTGRMVLVDAPEGGLSDRVLRAALDEAFLYLEAPFATASASVSRVTDVARNTLHY
ncbi:MAG: transketolase C-terminal domain-containing protein [Myxococcota bacterium]